MGDREHRTPPESEEAWTGALPMEVEFWRAYLSSGGLEWPEEFRYRLDPLAELDEVLRSVIDRLDTDHVAILDVGAGPMTIVGKRHPTKSLEITAVDPLAEQYDRLLEELGIEPPVRTSRCAGEELLDQFPPESFDVAHARNALDHGIDPLCSIRNMLAVVRPGGFVVLHHFPNEGASAEYEGLHQWNFDERNGRLLLSGRDGNPQDVGAHLESSAQLECFRPEKDLVSCIAWKRPRT